MGNFATAGKVKIFANMPNLEDEVINTFMPSAKRDVAALITSTKYDEVYNKGVNDDDYKNLEEAECYMLLKKLIPTINISSDGSGITKVQGTGDNKQENLSESDLDSIINRYDEWAMNILKDYIPAADVDEDDNTDFVKTPKITFIAI